MKKFTIFTLTLAMAASLLVGCGCMNTDEKVPTLPTNGETSTPTTAATVPTTTPATVPATTGAPTENTGSADSTDMTEGTTDATGTLEGAIDDIVGGSTDDTTMPADAGRSRSFGNGPRRK